MKAVRFYEYGGPEIPKVELDAPEPGMSAGMVLIEAVATRVNPIDWKVRSGARQKDLPGALLTHLPDGVDLIDAAAIPLVSMTGDQLVRLTSRVVAGQTILISRA